MAWILRQRALFGILECTAKLMPYLRRDLAVACRHEVETSAELDSEESRAVLADNALKLFPRLAARGDGQRTRSQAISQ